ncbi:DNA/RNA non-specific endonuclease [Nocardia sp. NPDC003963]
MATENGVTQPSPRDNDMLSAALHRYIRAEGVEFLNDPNISSIGVGYKITDGNPTGDISLQFTVDAEVGPDALEALETTRIPKSIEVEGLTITTDVLQRGHEPSFRVVGEATSPRSEVRLDPVAPGTSVADTELSAGTIGSIVYDEYDGTPPVSSDRHVLQQYPTAAVGAVRTGYDPNFLTTRIGTPTVDPAVHDDLFVLDGSEIIPYTHFSLVLSKSRRFARWVGWNIDGGSLKRINRSGIEFVEDPRIPAEFQVGNELYRANRVDRGHIARRADLLWATLPEAQRANTDSFFFTNITPQMDDFNQSRRNGVWGQLEDAVFADVDIEDLRVSVFGGPVFREDDRLYRDIRVPREFFKILAFVENGELKARGFLLTQNLNQLEALELDEFRVYQVAIAEIETRTRVRFDEELREAGTFTAPEAIEQRQPLDAPTDIRW